MAEPIDSMNQGRAAPVTRWAAVNAGAAQTLIASSTILHNGAPVARVNEAGNVAGIIVQPGVYDGQMLFLQNESNQTITMATAATSNVFGGTAIVLPASRSALMRWDAVQALWYANFSG